jgi:predicted subunit of tRNA(5-methylaminomethyl-2-thiouridylate) methyltransferase
MLRRPLLLVLLLAGCSKGPEADLPSISEARSLAAEWALVNEQAAKGQLTEKYVNSMHQAVREQLQTAAKSLTQPQADYASEIRQLLRETDDAAPAELRAHAGKLKQIEDALESA